MKKLKEQSLDENIIEERELGLGTFFLISTIVIIIWGIFWYLVTGMEQRGTFGDMFGAINALFSGLALSGIIYTMLLQKQELRLQRFELKANREELSRTATAQENSEKVLKKQAENLKATARLNALSTLMSYYNDRAAKYSYPERDRAEKRYEECKNEIEIILQGKS